MICRDCKNVKICKHYEYFCKYPDLELGKCNTFINISTNNPQNDFTINTVKDTTTEEYYLGDRPDLKGESFECLYCHQQIYDEEERVCEECGTAICDRCANYITNEEPIGSNDELKTHVICDDCYQEKYAKDDVISEETSIVDLLTNGMTDDEEIELEKQNNKDNVIEFEFHKSGDDDDR